MSASDDGRNEAVVDLGADLPDGLHDTAAALTLLLRSEADGADFVAPPVADIERRASSRRSSAPRLLVPAAAAVLVVLAGAVLVRSRGPVQEDTIVQTATSGAPSGATIAPPTTPAPGPLRLGFGPASCAAITAACPSSCGFDSVLAGPGPIEVTATADRRITTYRPASGRTDQPWVQLVVPATGTDVGGQAEVAASPTTGFTGGSLAPAATETTMTRFANSANGISRIEFLLSGRSVTLLSFGLSPDDAITMAATVRLDPSGWLELRPTPDQLSVVRTDERSMLAASSTESRYSWNDHVRSSISVLSYEPGSIGVFEGRLFQLFARQAPPTAANPAFIRTTVRGHDAFVRFDDDHDGVSSVPRLSVLWEESDRHALVEVDLVGVPREQLDATLATLVELDEGAWQAQVQAHAVPMSIAPTPADAPR